MHEYTLYSQIPAVRHTQVLQILAGLTASQPTGIREQVLIYQQLRPDSFGPSKKQPNARNAGGQQPKPSYVKLIRDVSAGEGGEWRFRAEDVPQPGITNLISRPVTERVLSDGEVEKFRQGPIGSYKYINQFILPGARFTYTNLLLRLTRPLSVPEGHGALEPLDAPLLPPSDLRPVDPSGCWLFEAIVTVEDGGNSKLVEQAQSELMHFKKQVEGAIDLRVPERLSLDTRVK